jgi:hypothetical protein
MVNRVVWTIKVSSFDSLAGVKRFLFSAAFRQNLGLTSADEKVGTR